MPTRKPARDARLRVLGVASEMVPLLKSGSLADTVIDASHAARRARAATGVQFDELSAQGELDAVRRTVHLHGRRSTWRGLQQAGMRAEVGWPPSARDYATLYRQRAPRPQETA